MFDIYNNFIVSKKIGRKKLLFNPILIILIFIAFLISLYFLYYEIKIEVWGLKKENTITISIDLNIISKITKENFSLENGTIENYKISECFFENNTPYCLVVIDIKENNKEEIYQKVILTLKKERYLIFLYKILKGGDEYA